MQHFLPRSGILSQDNCKVNLTFCLHPSIILRYINENSINSNCLFSFTTKIISKEFLQNLVGRVIHTEAGDKQQRKRKRRKQFLQGRKAA